MPQGRRHRAAAGALGALTLAAASLGVAPPAAAMTFGNYLLHIPDRRDFHTYVWNIQAPCYTPEFAKRTDCVIVVSVPQPIAKAIDARVEAELRDGRYTMVIDDPFGLRCGDIYFGPTIPTHDVYSWDPQTLTGELVSSFAAGCDGAPGGRITYPFFLTRM